MKQPALENLGRSNAISWWLQSCTAKMGRDSMSVVDANLKVYGIENLRIADISVMPRNRAAKSQRSNGLRGVRGNQVVSKRMVKKQQMRWTESGAHNLLQVRTKVLNDQLR